MLSNERFSSITKTMCWIFAGPIPIGMPALVVGPGVGLLVCTGVGVADGLPLGLPVGVTGGPVPPPPLPPPPHDATNRASSATAVAAAGFDEIRITRL